MRKERHLGLVNLIVAFVLIMMGIIIFFSAVLIRNNSKSKISGVLNDKDSGNDYVLMLGLPEDKIWEEAPNRWKQQFDFSIDVDSKTSLKDWEIEINFNIEGFKIIEIAPKDTWNVDKEKRIIEDQRIVLYPEVGQELAIETIAKGETNKFGFMIIMTEEISKEDFPSITYTLTGRNYRSPLTYVSIWVLLFALFVWTSFFIAYIVFRVRERNFEAFKENTYKIINQSMNTFASLIDTKDPYTKDHSARVSYYSTKIARKLGLDDEYVRNIAYIALMHDCGKLLIDDDILTKPAKLTMEEYEIMKTHTTNGGKALQNFTSIKEIVNGAMYHHEHYDGTGYPKGLKGEEIPLSARIIGVADALDAMASDRCYRKRLTEEVIKQELIECSGTQFDPKIANLVVEMINSGEINLKEDK